MVNFSRLKNAADSLSPQQKAEVNKFLAEHVRYGDETLLLKGYGGAEDLSQGTMLYNLVMSYLIEQGAMEKSAANAPTCEELRNMENAFHDNWSATFGPVLTKDLRDVCCAEWYRVVYVKADMLTHGSMEYGEYGYESCVIDFNAYRQQLINKICLDISITDIDALREAIKKANNEIFKQPD